MGMLDAITPDEDYELWRLLIYTREAIQKARADELAKYGITPRQSGILLAVDTISNNATPADIARFLKRDPSSITSLLKRMERKGLITKSNDLKKKNMIRITLTEKGRQVFYMTQNRRSLHRIFATLSEEEYKQTQSCLYKLLSKAYEETGDDL
jgi:DNA-binding MarR family transcriptional regulator